MISPELLRFYPVEHLAQLPKNNQIRREIEKMAQRAPRFVAADRAETIIAVKPEEFTTPPELNPEAEWQRQSQNFLRYKFHIERGFADTDEGKRAYLDTLPKFEPQPEEYKGRLDKPMLVEKKIPWQRQAQLARIAISEYLKSRPNETRQWEGNRHDVPDDVVAYTGWFNNWDQRFPDPIKPFDARDQLAVDEQGGDPYEGVAQEIHFPEDTANGKYFDLIGYSVGSDHVVGLDRLSGRPGLDASFGGSADPRWRPLVRGSKVVTRQLAA